MARLTAGQITAIEAKLVRPALFVRIETTSSPILAWSGVGDFTLNSEVYTGVGNFGRIPVIEESKDLRAIGVTLELSGIPSALISSALGLMRQDKQGQIFLAFLDANHTVIDTHYELFSGLTDLVEIDESSQTSRILVNLENRILRLRRIKAKRYTDEEQQAEFPGDLGFEYMTQTEKSLIWGR